MSRANVQLTIEHRNIATSWSIKSLYLLARIVLGELRFWSSAASERASRSFFVSFSYFFKALFKLKIGWKLDDDSEESW